MERFELLTVESTYAIKPDMLILEPSFCVPKAGWKDRIEKVVVLRPDGLELDATAKISMAHLNIRDPNVAVEKRYMIVLWLTDRTAAEVPIGSRIWVSREVGDILSEAGFYKPLGSKFS